MIWIPAPTHHAVNRRHLPAKIVALFNNIPEAHRLFFFCSRTLKLTSRVRIAEKLPPTLFHNFYGAVMNKTHLASLFLAATFAAPVIAFARSNQGLTNAEVRQELVDLQGVGYVPGSDRTQYPRAIQAAEQRLANQDAASRTSYGSSSAGRTDSGIRATVTTRSLYRGH